MEMDTNCFNKLQRTREGACATDTNNKLLKYTECHQEMLRI